MFKEAVNVRNLFWLSVISCSVPVNFTSALLAFTLVGLVGRRGLRFLGRALKCSTKGASK